MAGASTGDFDYETKGGGYARQRRTDPRIAALVHRALGDARTVLNVGAGAGSYEPEDRHVLALEPAAAMRAQRPPHLAPAIIGVAESLPFDDLSVDASMAMVTVHQWPDLATGLGEMRRVTRGPVLVLSFDGDAFDRYWLGDYVPELMEAERRRMPSMAAIREGLGGRVEILSVPIPADCVDGFTEAFYARPEMLLDASVRRAQSSWGFIDRSVEERFVATLSADLKSGAWDDRYGLWRQAPFFDGSLRLIVGLPAA
ncbi:MAG: methyltransferase domain-containing protein [Parvibaculum sp.]|uniref:class I SAM-dependent methyltransferase n=1 Tax=Parvibaculum sp. TaxID=2024848 RepID=UPI00283D1B7F|nr:methyltransferase domain-containing protein [Parvibaculum sp.]MDR3500590.1 methyltransferase domain-containing protein [Parvibaculum sp.]